MKKALLTLMCLTAMMAASTSLKAQEVTIVLNPGWTWISHPSADTLDFATALGSFTPATGDIIKSRWGQAIYTNNHWMGSISQFYPGYGYMYKSNRTVPVMLTFNMQQPAPQVIVTTSEPLLITAISAMCGGEVTVSDGTYIIVKGLCWATHENPTTNDDFYQEAESGVGSFSLSMTGLNISTTYYVRAYAVTGNGTVYGDQKTFTTRDGIPTLTTDSVVDITGATATCGGNITDNGGLNVTARGVCWSTSPNPTVADLHTTNGNGNGNFTSSITGLNVSTTYYVRAYATTAAGTGYGDEKTFTTRDGIPTLTTAEVTNITGITASSGGNITDNGGLNVTVRGVCWSTSPNPTVADSHTTNGNGNGSFSSSITGLSVSTTYYVRAYATTAAGTGYGEQVSFTTRNGIPALTTAEVMYIGGGWAYSGGNITDDGGLAITAKGVCWSISPYPTLADSHTNDGSGAGSFTSGITGLEPNTTYYVRAYVTNSFVTVYGNQQSFNAFNLPIGAINGFFSVSANQQVYFSQGNLQYQPSSNTWRFAENQWDLIVTPDDMTSFYDDYGYIQYYADATSQYSPTSDAWIDLFCWGTSGYNHGAICYQPWDTSMVNSDYYAYGNSSYNLFDQTGQADWGYNAISNGGNQENQWRTLTASECEYIFNSRTGIRYAKAKVNGVNGLILLPDGWSSSTYNLNNTNQKTASFNTNIISAFQWDYLEQNGAVFLPAAGYRGDETGPEPLPAAVEGVGSMGCYWLSTRVADKSFGDNYINNVETYMGRSQGKSVRLVRNVQ